MNKIKVYFIIFIVVTSTIGQMAAEIYIPSLPYIARYFQVDDSLVQLSLSVFLFGLALPGIFFGHISDYLGRRKILIIATTIGLIGNLLCLSATNIYLLILGRFIQGLGLSGVGSTSRAILRDKMTGVELAKYSSYLAIILVIVIDTAPFIGGVLQEYVGWRSIFGVLLMYNILAIVFSYRYVDDDKVVLNESLNFRGLPQIVLNIVKNKIFMKYNLIATFTYVAIMLYLTAASFFFVFKIGLSPAQFGTTTLALAMVYITGSFINGKLLKYVSMDKLISNGAILMMLATSLLFAMAFIIEPSYWLMLVFVSFVYLACGQLFSNSSASAFTAMNKNVGVSSAVYSSIQILVAAIFTAILSLFSNATVLPFACLMLVVCICLILLSLWKPNQVMKI